MVGGRRWRREKWGVERCRQRGKTFFVDTTNFKGGRGTS